MRLCAAAILDLLLFFFLVALTGDGQGAFAVCAFAGMVVTAYILGTA